MGKRLSLDVLAMRSAAAALWILAATVLAPTAGARGCPELVGRWPYGRCAAVAADAGLIVMGNGAVLEGVDIADPTVPRVVGELVLPDVVAGIALAGSYDYVADYYDGLQTSAPPRLFYRVTFPGAVTVLVKSGATVRVDAM